MHAAVNSQYAIHGWRAAPANCLVGPKKELGRRFESQTNMGTSYHLSGRDRQPCPLRCERPGRACLEGGGM